MGGLDAPPDKIPRGEPGHEAPYSDSTLVGSILRMLLNHFGEYFTWPWFPVNSFKRQILEHPSFAFAEVFFIAFALCALIHACTSPDPKGTRRLKMLWIGSLFVGTVNDYFFMLLPTVDNFWQAQAIIMLSPRMPLYIPCVYICFMYWSTMAAARVFRFDNRSRIAEACLAGLLGGILYAPYDINGAKFLWWTWHHTDPAISLRWFGVPAGSTEWTIVFTACFSYLLRCGADWGWNEIETLGLACLSTPVMIVLFGPLTLLGVEELGKPGTRTLIMTIAVFAGVVLHFLMNPRRASNVPFRLPSIEKHSLTIAFAAYFAAHVFTMAHFNPKDTISTGVHQEWGPCNVVEADMLGYTRHRYICKDHYPTEYFSTDCPSSHQKWKVAKLKVTDEVEVRDERTDEWMRAEVTSLNPIKAKASGWWREIKWTDPRPDDHVSEPVYIRAPSQGRWQRQKPSMEKHPTWYTVCGLPHKDGTHYVQYVMAELGLCMLGFWLYFWTFSCGAGPSEDLRKKLLRHME